jgi:ABC-2 type transport system ATP-binding protein
MARRIGLAQALINDPDLLILDEPTTGLDPIGTKQIKDLIVEMSQRGKTILLCSHLLADVEDVCDRISILYGGSIQAQGQVQELLQQTYKTQIVTESLSPDTIEKIEGLIRDENKSYEITSPMEKLESFFIRTVTEAQTRLTPTSGAVSTTQIGDFLTAKEKEQTILEKLVTGQTQPQEEQKSEQISQTAEVQSVEQQSNDLIEKLTTQQEDLKPVDQTEDIKSKPEEQEKVRHDLLKELTESDNNKEKQPDENTESNENA